MSTQNLQIISVTKKNAWSQVVLRSVLTFLAVALLVACSSKPRVGELRTESQSVDLGDAKSVSVKINMGAGDLKLTGGAAKLLDANFTYNVDSLKPEVKYTDGTLIVQQPETEGLPDLRGIRDFRNEWGLQLNGEVPMDLRVQMGAGNSDLQLADLSLTGLGITLGAGNSTVDLSGDWPKDLQVSIDTGAGDITLRLPKHVGVRVNVDRGPTIIKASGMTQVGSTYTNEAYGVSDVTMQVILKTDIGQVNLDVE
jgi:hypothetical protein